MHVVDVQKMQIAVTKLYVHNCAMREQLGLWPYTHQTGGNSDGL